MSERPTPETDAIVRNAATADHPMTRLAATLTVKCEKLERERDEAREDLEFRRGLYKVQDQLFNKARSERDEALEDLEEEKKFHHRTHAELIQTQCRLMDVTQAIILTLEENRHLADGDNCTLAKLKSVVPDWK